MPTSEPPTSAPDQFAGGDLVPLPRQRKRGPKPIGSALLRVHTVSVRLNSSELADLDSARAGVKMQRGEYLRAASIGKLPPTIPSINREAWANLARVCGNLNQHQAQINAGLDAGYPPEMIESLRDLVQLLRADLLGLAGSEADSEGED